MRRIEKEREGVVGDGVRAREGSEIEKKGREPPPAFSRPIENIDITIKSGSKFSNICLYTPNRYDHRHFYGLKIFYCRE